MSAILDALEQRRLMAGTAYTTFTDGTLRVFGTDADDQISIALAYQIQFNRILGGDRLYLADPVYVVWNRQIIGTATPDTLKRVFVYGGEGNDRLRVFSDMHVSRVVLDDPDASTAFTLRPRVVLDGGAGNDTLTGGDGRDVFVGGDGIDTVDYSKSNRAVAIVFGLAEEAGGANGPLFLDGRATIDERSPAIYDGRGNVVEGVPVTAYDLPDLTHYHGCGDEEGDIIEPDVENAVGSRFNDVIVGNTQANVLHGGAGRDWIAGGLGDDTLYGGAGRDLLLSADTRNGFPIIVDSVEELLGKGRGYDRVVGGPDADIVRGDPRDVLVSAERHDILSFLWS